MTLDSRARRAARAIQDSVALVTPEELPVANRHRRASVVAGLAGAVAIALAAIGLASMLTDRGPDGGVALVTTTLPGAAIADRPVAVVPGGDGDGVVTVAGPELTDIISTSPDPSAQFAGTAEPGTVVVATSPYGSTTIEVGASREFNLMLEFEGAPPGVSFPVTVTVGQTEYGFGFTSAWNPYAAEITAYQAYGVSYEATPFEQFFGTAPPGTPISITSAYGSAEAEALEEGRWYASVSFEGAPTDEPFDVTVIVGAETFSFTFMWSTQAIVVEPEFTINQEITGSRANNPYTRFTGTAAVGTVVVASSDYGSAEITVDESGLFDFRVDFLGAPVGEAFTITIAVDGEPYAAYSFVRYPSGPVAFTLHQDNTESSDPYPFVRFYGTAEPDTEVVASSEYGSMGMMVGPDGIFDLIMYFWELPPAELEIPITVIVDGEEYGVYSFTSHFVRPPIEFSLTQSSTESWDSMPWVEFYGTAEPGTRLAAVSDYGSVEAEVYSDGSFYMVLFFDSLPPADVEIPITVIVNDEQYGTYPFTSHFVLGPVEFTLSQYNTASWETEPWVEFYGTAEPGTRIVASSEYGSAEADIYPDGTYYLVLSFTNLPPAGEEFPITITVDGAVYGTYLFTSYSTGELSELTVMPTVIESDGSNPFAQVEYTAAVGTTIELVSEFGSTSVTLKTTRTGYLNLVFSETLPPGMPFPVTVFVDGGEYGTFYFTSWYGATEVPGGGTVPPSR